MFQVNPGFCIVCLDLCLCISGLPGEQGLYDKVPSYMYLTESIEKHVLVGSRVDVPASIIASSPINDDGSPSPP